MENTETTEQLIAEILKSSKEAMKTSLQSAVKAQVMEQLTWSLREKIGKITSEFVEKEMTEDIKASLLEAKPIILESLQGAFVKIGASVAMAMYQQAEKNLMVNSYNVREILKKLID